MRKKVRWGIMGTANIAKERFIPALLESNNAELYAIAGRTPKKLEDFKVFNPTIIYDSYEKLLDDENVDVVYIPLPNNLHYEWVLKAAKKNKNILCEKPLALTALEVEKMIEATQENNIILSEAYGYLYGDIMAKVEEIIKSGIIGEIRYVDVRFGINVENPNDIRYKKECGGGSVYDLGGYAVSFIRSVIKFEPNKIQCILGMDDKTNVDLNANTILEFPKGVKANFYVDIQTFYDTFRTIVGSKGTLLIPTPYNASGKAELTLINEKDKVKKIDVLCRNHYTIEIEHFGDCVLNGLEPKVSLEYSLKNARVIDKILDTGYNI